MNVSAWQRVVRRESIADAASVGIRLGDYNGKEKEGKLSFLPYEFHPSRQVTLL